MDRTAAQETAPQRSYFKAENPPALASACGVCKSSFFPLSLQNVSNICEAESVTVLPVLHAQRGSTSCCPLTLGRIKPSPCSLIQMGFCWGGSAQGGWHRKGGGGAAESCCPAHGAGPGREAPSRAGAAQGFWNQFRDAEEGQNEEAEHWL